MNEEQYELPEGWEWTTLNNISDAFLGKTPKKTEYCDEGNHKIIKFRDIGTHKINWEEYDKGFVIDDEKIHSQLRQLSIGMILVTSSAHAAQHIGKKTALITCMPEYFDKVFFVGELLGIKPYGNLILSKLIYYYLSSINGYKEIQRRVRGVHLIDSEAKKIEIPLPPKNQHILITEKIECLFGKIEAGQAQLDKLPRLLKQFRQTVLAAACSGCLVPQDPNDEPASELLKRIQEDRRARWEIDLIAKGKDPGKAKYPEPEPVDTTDLPELPEGWVWTSVDSLCTHVVDCLHSTPKFTLKGYMCIDTNTISQGQVHLDKVRYVSEDSYQERIRRLKPRFGDILFSREGALLGISAISPDIDFCLGQRIMMFRLSLEINNYYFMQYLASPFFQSQIQSKVLGTASPHVNIGDIKKMVIAIPPYNQQLKIIEKINCITSAISFLDIEAHKLETVKAQLEQSILSKAFRGELVEQDSADEPASVLLERIRAEKALLKTPKPKPSKSSQKKEEVLI